MTDQQTSTRQEALEMLGTLAEDEVATFDWLMTAIRDGFGASDRFHQQDSVFAELTNQLVSRVL